MSILISSKHGPCETYLCVRLYPFKCICSFECSIPDEPEQISAVYEEVDRMKAEGRFKVATPWEGLQLPTVKEMLPDQSAPDCLRSVVSRLWKATGEQWGAPHKCLGCRAGKASQMLLCELCREWYHRRCIQDSRNVVDFEAKEYFCPLHDIGNSFFFLNDILVSL